MQQRPGSTNYMDFDTDNPRQYIFGFTKDYTSEKSKQHSSPQQQQEFTRDINDRKSNVTGGRVGGYDTNGRVQSAILLKSEDYSHQEHQNIVSTKSPAVGEYLAPPQVELISPSNVHTSYPYSNSYNAGLVSSYGPQAPVQNSTVGAHHTRMPLPSIPLEVMEEPVYVNPKQYRGILRRRQSRAKAELEKKPIKTRKSYLHESRHLHAMRRARGSGGRFLNTKKLEAPSSNTSSSKNANYSSSNTINMGNNGEPVFEKEVWEKESVQSFKNYDTNNHYNPYKIRSESSMLYSFLNQGLVGDVGISREQRSETKPSSDPQMIQYLM